jgi:hypothetical protein
MTITIRRVVLSLALAELPPARAPGRVVGLVALLVDDSALSIACPAQAGGRGCHIRLRTFCHRSQACPDYGRTRNADAPSRTLGGERVARRRLILLVASRRRVPPALDF